MMNTFTATFKGKFSILYLLIFRISLFNLTILEGDFGVSITNLNIV